MKANTDFLMITGCHSDLLQQVASAVESFVPAQSKAFSYFMSDSVEMPTVMAYVMPDLSKKHLHNIAMLKRKGCKHLLVVAQHVNVPLLCDIVRARVDDVVLWPMYHKELQRLQDTLLPLLGRDAQLSRQPTDAELDEFSVHSALAFEEIVQQVEAQFCDKLTLVTVARQMNLSPSRISHLFKDVCGLCFRQYLTCRRLEEAENLLVCPRANITNVAFSLGFASTSHFCRVFKDMFGITPTSYQSGNREFVLNPTFARYQHLRLTLLPQVIDMANDSIPAQRLRMFSVG